MEGVWDRGVRCVCIEGGSGRRYWIAGIVDGRGVGRGAVVSIRASNRSVEGACGMDGCRESQRQWVKWRNNACDSSARDGVGGRDPREVVACDPGRLNLNSPNSFSSATLAVDDGQLACLLACWSCSIRTYHICIRSLFLQRCLETGSASLSSQDRESPLTRLKFPGTASATRPNGFLGLWEWEA